MSQATTSAKDPVRSWKAEDRVCDAASIEMLNKAAVDCVDTCFGRLDSQRNQCTFGKNGVCCRLCYMGPCRITPKALHGAVWSGGAFCYIPKGVTCDLPLQSYFRMEGAGEGTFEHTLIIADEGSEVNYIEGCTAQTYSVNSMH